MNFLPYERLQLTSLSTPAEVTARLRSIICERRWLRGASTPFRGTLDARRFKVQRVLPRFYGNAFLPVVAGTVEPSSEGTVVRVRMRLTWFAAAFMAVWFGALAFAALRLLATAAAFGFGARPCETDPAQACTGAGVGLVAVGAMALFGHGLMSVAFWPEARKARALLAECVAGRLAPRPTGTALAAAHDEGPAR